MTEHLIAAIEQAWDNRAAVHYAVRNYGDFPRELHRILIEDEPLWADL